MIFRLIVCLLMLLPAGVVWAGGGNYAGQCASDFTIKSQINTLEARAADLSSAGNADEAARLQSQASALRDMLAGNGFISKTATEIKAMVNNAGQQIYEGIIGGGFPQIVATAILLYIIIFGAMFMLGMVQTPLFEMMVRIVKMLIVAVIVGGGPGGGAVGWEFFNEYVVEAVQATMDLTIMTMTGVIGSYSGRMLGVSADVGGAAQSIFAPLDILFTELVQPSTLMKLQAAMNTPPYGVIYCLILLFGGLFLIGALARALWVYLVSVLALAFMFGIAPLFVVTMLFERTKGMFQQWVSQVLNFMLQPILMFTFLAFFVVLLDQSVKDMLVMDACFTEMFTAVQSEGLGSTLMVCSLPIKIKAFT